LSMTSSALFSASLLFKSIGLCFVLLTSSSSRIRVWMRPDVTAFNTYSRQLSPDEILAGAHRDAVGGLWDQMGRLQCDFLISAGLRPEHRFIDVGCGALRGGVHFVKYLAPGHYYGLDVNESLIEAGKRELQLAGLSDRGANLLVNDRFEVFRFDVPFDHGIAQSLFSHLPLNHIISCLVQVKRALAPRGSFHATYFAASRSAHLETIVQSPGGIRTSYEVDPFHYSFEEMSFAARLADLAVERVDWDHPRAQRMLCFTHAQGSASP
jgi:SAM-dependent methyltransferase